MKVLLAFLLLLDPDRPEALDAFGLVSAGCMVVALMWVDLGYAESEE